MVDLSDVQRAMERLEGKVNRTEVAPDHKLAKRLGTEVCLKWENHQITGAFKVRGGLNTVLSLPEEERGGGCSSEFVWKSWLGTVLRGQTGRYPGHRLCATLHLAEEDRRHARTRRGGVDR